MKTFNARLGARALLLSLRGSPFATIIRAARFAAGRWLVAAVFLWAAGMRADEPAFTNVTATVVPGLRQVERGSVAWGDYDNDGRLDFLLTGILFDGEDDVFLSQLWRNTGSGFADVTATVAPGLPGLFLSSVAWGDYDNDGRLDLLLTGYINGDYGISQVWRNTGSGFTNVTAAVAPGLPQVGFSSVAWGDYDKDGRLDFLLTGFFDYDGGRHFLSQLWRNTTSGFTNVTASAAADLPGISNGSVAWGDYDNDGWLDFLLTGYADGVYVSQVWRNIGSGFTNVTATVAPGLPQVGNSSVAWGDYDNDGRLDLLLTGTTNGNYSGTISRLWRNTGSGFTDVTATVAPGLPGVSYSSVAWGDYDNDGRLDFLLTGYSSSSENISQLWRNTGGGFANVTDSVMPGLPAVNGSSVAWGDYDNDGRLDFLITGTTNFSGSAGVSQLWRNKTAATNPPPTVITGLPGIVDQASAALNVRINPRGLPATAWFIWGDSTNYGQVTAAQPMGNGNSFTNFSQAITGLSTGVTYYYRAVGSNDQGLVVLGLEQRFLLAAPGVTTSSAEIVGPTAATLYGEANPNNLPAYGWFEWGLTPAYGQVTPVQILGSGFNSSFAENLSGLEANTTYYFRAVASNSLGVAYGAGQSLTTPVVYVCPGSISPTKKSFGYSGWAHSVSLSLQCNWIAINTNSWITILATNGTAASSSLTYNVAENKDPQPRSGNITIGGHNFLVTQGVGPSAFVAQPPVQSVLGGGTATFSVPFSLDPPYVYQWQLNGVPLTDGNGISGASTSNLVLTGVQYSQAGSYRMIAANSAGATIGFSSLATLTVTCGFTLSSNDASFGSLSATGLVSLGAATTDCPWNIVNTNAWVSILSGIIDSGSGTVVYALEANSTAIARSGSLLIGDQTFTITQDGGTSTSAPISLAEALDSEGVLSWSTIGTPAWFGEALLSQDGVDAAQSGPVGHNAAVTVQTTVTGQGTVSFWWKVSSETNCDYLKFFINGVQQTRISGEADWLQETFATPSGATVLKWTYSKNYSGTAGQDRGWLDQVQFVPSNPCNLALSPTNGIHDAISSTGFVSVSTFPGCSWTVVNTNDWVEIISGGSGSGNGLVEYYLTENAGALRIGNLVVADQLFTITQLAPSTNAVPLIEALDTWGLSLDWGTIGVPAWFGQTSVSHDGEDAAQSGPLAHNTAVTAHTAVDGPGAISFWWKVSSEYSKDYLKFFINGVQQTRISGEVNWEPQRYTVPAGPHVFKWTYSKNISGSAGLDRGWVNQVYFLAGTGSCVMTLSQTNATHSSNSETGLVNVTATRGCTWVVTNTNPWITHTIGGDETNGFVRYTLAVNYSGAARTGVVTIADQPFTVVQLGDPTACATSISPTDRNFGYGAVTGVISVSAPAGCAWSVVNDNPWVTILSTSGGLVNYFVSANPAPVARIGTIRIGGKVFLICQSGAPPCTYSISPISTPRDSASATGVVFVTTQANCPWNVFNTNAWVNILSIVTNTAGGEVTYSISANTTPATRTGRIQIGSQFFTISQSGVPCDYSISPSGGTHSSGSATGTVALTTLNGCAWSVVNTNSWISILSGLSNSSSGTVIYSLAPNTNTNARGGSIIIGGQHFLLTQAGASPGTNASRLQFMSRTETGTTLSVQGEEGKVYVVECSEDLIHWIPISTNSAPSTVTDAAAGTAPWRFYRTVAVP